MYCWVALGAMLAVVGLTAMETSGFCTINEVEPEIEPEVALMVDVAPGVTAVANPVEEMVAPAVALQVTVAVMFWVVVSA